MGAAAKMTAPRGCAPPSAGRARHVARASLPGCPCLENVLGADSFSSHGSCGHPASCVLRIIFVSLISRGGWPIRGWRGRGSGSAGGMKCHGPVFWARRSRAGARTAAAPFCRSQAVFFVSRWSRAAASAVTLAASSSSSIQPSWWKSSNSLIRLLGLRPSCPASNSPMMMQR